MTGDGEMHVDYSIDLGQLLKEDNPDVKPGEDIRQLLIDKYPVVPAYSVPYTVDENGEPTYFMEAMIVMQKKAREKAIEKAKKEAESQTNKK